MKYFILLLSVFTFYSCQTSNYSPANNALDAAREFTVASWQGNFAKAKFYCVGNNKIDNQLKELEKKYNSLSSEQVKQYKTASIQIHQVKTTKDGTTIIFSSNINSNKDSLLIVNINGNWLVNL